MRTAAPVRDAVAGAVLEQWLGRWAPVLDALQTNVLLADTELTLRYMNPRSYHTLKSVEEEVRAVFHLGVDEMVGGSIHRFHRHPMNVEQILRNSHALPHSASFSFGNVTLNTRINKLVVDGDLLGFLVNWEDISNLSSAKHGIDALDEQLHSVSASVHEMGAAIQMISEATQHAALTAREGVELAQVATQAVGELGVATTEIQRSVASITKVAAQTRLLALNATIEAASAGAAGKGFTVVANEVKALAKYTTDTAEAINTQIRGIAGSVEHVIASIERISETISAIADGQTQVAGAVEEQHIVTNDISGRAASALQYNRQLKRALEE